MKMHGDWVFSITLGYIMFAAFLLLQVHRGTDPMGAVAVGLFMGGGLRYCGRAQAIQVGADATQATGRVKSGLPLAKGCVW